MQRNSCLIFSLILAILLPSVIRAEEDAFSRTRHKAALLALLCYNPDPTLAKTFSCQRAQLSGLCRSFVQEGGYDPVRAANILAIRDPEVNHLSLLIRDLEGKPEDLPRPGALPMASAVALAYTEPCADGLRAAIHAGRYVSADPDQAAVCKAAYSMIVYALEGKLEKKEELLNVAAINTDDERVAQEIRAVSLRELRKLPEEKTLLGRFCRAIFVWQRGQGWEQTMAMGRRSLQYPESMQFLAVLSAAWSDLPGLPENFVWTSLQEKELRDLSTDLHALAKQGVLAPVSRKLLVSTPTDRSNSSKSEGTPINGADDEQVDRPLEPIQPLRSLNPLSSPESLNSASASSPSAPAVTPAPVLATTARSANATRASRTANATPSGTGQTGDSASNSALLQPAMPATPAQPRQPGQVASNDASQTATLTVQAYDRQRGERTFQTKIPVPAPEAPESIAQRPLPQSPASAPLSRAARPARIAAETEENIALPDAPEYAGSRNPASALTVSRATAADAASAYAAVTSTTVKTPATSTPTQRTAPALRPAVVVPADSLAAEQFPLE